MSNRLIAFGLTIALPALCRGADEIDFRRDIRPILSEKCYHCHGPDSAQRQADLRFDSRESAVADRGGYAAVWPGEPSHSELLRRVFSTDDDERMPPREAKIDLSDAQKERLRQWIEQGAPWQEHWAFVAPVEPDRPVVNAESWCRNPIDRFVLARLNAQNRAPSAEADRITLLRRVTLDLTGLPPTPAEVSAFLADSSDDAYERVVDSLLRSKRYGERMAWPWLEASRYADTDGFQGDPTRTMWPWRDWLVGALNENMPFDQFTIEMLSGDLLPDATPEQVIATAFNRNHMVNGEGGRIAEETRIENVFDRAETTATIWLGLTLTCARCHDHKYDPLTQHEYYGLFAFFNNSSERGVGGGGKAPPAVKYLAASQRKTVEELTATINAIDRRILAAHPDVDRAQADWESAIRRQLADQPTGALQASDWSVLGTIPAPDGSSAEAFRRDLGPESGVDLKRKYTANHIGWRSEPKFKDGKVHPLPDTVGATYLYRTITSPEPRSVEAWLGSDDGIKVWLNGRELLAKNVVRVTAPDQDRVTLELQPGENRLLLKIVNGGGAAGFFFRTGKQTIDGLPLDIAEAVRMDPDVRTAEQTKQIRQFYRQHHSPNHQRLFEERQSLDQRKKQINSTSATVMVMDELPPDRRRPTFVLSRGTYNKPLDAVTAGTPAFLPPLPADAPLNRLTLARWLVARNNPLTARVTVNRYWQMFFGRGLVQSVEDFGRQGSVPSHPQLLDWLATYFVDSGWDVKAVHRLIVTSATYRQSSRFDAAVESDPDNRWLGRGARFRMPSWMLRDQALAASGLLAERIGGASVRPYQPDGIWAEATFGKIQYQNDAGEALYRRSLYIFWRRIVGPTMLFDSGKRQTCEVKPTRTNTPLHALTTLNETTFVEAARALGQEVMYQSAGAHDGVDCAFRRLTARSPTSVERNVLAGRWQKYVAEFQQHPADARRLLAIGQSPRDATLDEAEHAAWTVICSTIMNLDEVLTRE